MNLWHDIAVGEKAPETFTMIVEIPRGSKNKYEIDKKTGLIRLDRAMKTAQDYPFDYGFIPQTLWEDNDPVDVVLLTTYPLQSGIMVDARPVAVMRMTDCGESDDKIIAVPKSDPRWDDVKDLEDVNKHVIKEIQHFFETYKTIDGKKVTIDGVEGYEKAKETIIKGMALYTRTYRAQ